MSKLLQKIVVFVVGGLIIDGIYFVATNKLEGKTIFGNKPKEKKKTKVNWKGYIILGSEDYEIRDCA